MQKILQSDNIELEYGTVDNIRYYFINKEEAVKFRGDGRVELFEALDCYGNEDMSTVVDRIFQIEFDTKINVDTFKDLAEYHGVSGAIAAILYIYIKDNPWLDMEVDWNFRDKEELEEISNETEFYNYDEVLNDLK